jgi:hypothetical protein
VRHQEAFALKVASHPTLVFEQPIEMPTSRDKVFGPSNGERKCWRIALRTRAVRSRSISALVSTVHSAAAAIAAVVDVQRFGNLGESLSIRCGSRRLGMATGEGNHEITEKIAERSIQGRSESPRPKKGAVAER